ncbi:MAG: hypothetical protein NVS1B2_21930 [Vulcanimicrobiaceae bacterium]
MRRRQRERFDESGIERHDTAADQRRDERVARQEMPRRSGRPSRRSATDETSVGRTNERCDRRDLQLRCDFRRQIARIGERRRTYGALDAIDRDGAIVAFAREAAVDDTQHALARRLEKHPEPQTERDVDEHPSSALESRTHERIECRKADRSAGDHRDVRKRAIGNVRDARTMRRTPLQAPAASAQRHDEHGREREPGQRHELDVGRTERRS